MNRPLHRRSRTNPEPITTQEYKDPCEACKNCEYKQMVISAMSDMSSKIDKPTALPFFEHYPPKVGFDARNPIKDEKKPEGILKRFSQYIAKNQAANKAAGDTTLMEDLGKWGANISSGAAKLGEEEIAGLDRRKASTAQRDPRKDDELVDFLTGKKARK
jgi:hypothetical protein